MICDLHQNTDEWLEFRKKRIGASEAPIILGVSPWTTPLQLWEQKLNLVERPAQTMSMSRGIELEPVALDLFNKMIGITLKPTVVQSTEFEWMIASLDGFDGVKTAVEIKCPGRHDHQTALDGKIPEKYIPQLQHQLYVTCLESMWYTSFDGKEAVHLQVHADKEYQNKMIKLEIAFYKCMEEFTPPPMGDKDYQIKNDTLYLKLCEDYCFAKRDLCLLQNQERHLREELIKANNGLNTIGGGLKISKCIRKGAIDYKIISELRGIDLDMFRSDPVISWRITEMEGEVCSELF
jgi:putative phage-type endonuclease